MACQCHLSSSLSSSSSSYSPLFLRPRPRPSYRPAKFRSRPSIASRFSTRTAADSDGDGENAGDRRRPWVRFDFLKLSVTLTVISASLPQAKSALAAVKERKRGGGGPKKSAAKKAEPLSPQELKSWVQGLPVVSNRMPYSEVLELREKGELKHVIKPSGVTLRRTAEPVLVVLEDSRVLRTMLPSVEGDKKFWDEWDRLSIDTLCVNAYTPPLKTPEVPPSYLGFLSNLPDFLLSFTKPKKESKRAAELRRTREALKQQMEAIEENARKEKQEAERAAKNQRREEERRARLEALERKGEESMEDAQATSAAMAGMWIELADNQVVTVGLGIFFFYIFYRTVVLGYRKQRKDYEDRLKIEKADAEERRKMNELQIDMAAAEEESEEGGEENQYLKMAQQFMRSGARVRRARSRRPPQYLETGVDVKFEDVAGLGKIRLELEEIVKFFTHGEMYRRRGVKIPGGILLCGPPGVGKTLLAKAVAGEAGVNFFSISASQFVEIYVGVGASRVRALYQEARENAPSVVFIDELDAVGRERGLIKGSGGQERDATLNQLLVSLDGFEGRGEVITIASTNRPDILDPALVRPGRFDRKIYIPKPGVIGRVEILKVHARKKPMAPDVDYLAVANITNGMVGAELANIVEVAAINMMRDGRAEITTDDLLQAAQMEERGMLDRKERSPEMWRRVAINEAATAVATANFPDLGDIEFLTIAPRAGRELGYLRTKMDRARFDARMLTRQTLLDHITVLLASRAADGIYFGEDQLSTIWAETANNARSAARTYVLSGLSSKHHGMSNFYVADRINDLDSEALQILHMCYERAKEILNRNRKFMDAVVDELVEKKSLSKQDFLRLEKLHGCLNPSPPTLFDLRVSNQKRFQDQLTEQSEIASGSKV